MQALYRKYPNSTRPRYTSHRVPPQCHTIGQSPDYPFFAFPPWARVQGGAKRPPRPSCRNSPTLRGVRSVHGVIRLFYPIVTCRGRSRLGYRSLYQNLPGLCVQHGGVPHYAGGSRDTKIGHFVLLSTSPRNAGTRSPR